MTAQPIFTGDIKALSLWEPWASFMRLGRKKNETRSWPTQYRGPLLICAAKKTTPKTIALAHHHGLRHLLCGEAVALVDLVDCVRTEDLNREIDAREALLGDYSPKRYAWITENLRVIKLFPVKGKQGLFNVNVEIYKETP